MWRELSEHIFPHENLKQTQLMDVAITDCKFEVQ